MIPIWRTMTELKVVIDKMALIGLSDGLDELVRRAKENPRTTLEMAQERVNPPDGWEINKHVAMLSLMLATAVQRLAGE